MSLDWEKMFRLSSISASFPPQCTQRNLLLFSPISKLVSSNIRSLRVLRLLLLLQILDLQWLSLLIRQPIISIPWYLETRRWWKQGKQWKCLRNYQLIKDRHQKMFLWRKIQLRNLFLLFCMLICLRILTSPPRTRLF